MQRRWVWVAWLSALALVGCDDGGADTDAGAPGLDAGSGGVDAGPGEDAGPPVVPDWSCLGSVSLATPTGPSTLDLTLQDFLRMDPIADASVQVCAYADAACDTPLVEGTTDAAGRVVREEPITVTDGPCIHDCAITPRYVIVLDLPVTFSMALLLAGHPFPYRWNREHPARVGLLPRTGTAADMRWYAVDPCFVFHPANAFERADGSVVVDVVAHDRMFDDHYDGPDGSRMSFERWTLAPGAAAVAREIVDNEGQEFPRYDERRTGSPYRYAYCMAAAAAGPGLVTDTRLFRHDLERGERAVHDFGPGRHPGEFVFVPRSADAAEDDGWLLGLVVDMNDDTTALTVLDAADFTAPPLATVTLPHRVPPGFHGNWIAAGASA